MPRAAAKPSFKVADANRVLPLVRSIVTDIVANFQRMRDLTREQRALKAAPAAQTSEVSVAAIAALRSEAEDRSTRMDDYLRELADLGVDLKDPERGLVDFACEVDGRTVLLCWELGESSVAYWHGVDENVFDRRPMSTLPSAASLDTGKRTRTESGGTHRTPDRREGGSNRDSDRREGDAGPTSA